MTVPSDPRATPSAEPAFMPLRTQHEERVLRLARKWARMKLHHAYIENNVIVRVARVDAENLYGKHFESELKDACESLLLAMATDEKNGELCE